MPVAVPLVSPRCVVVEMDPWTEQVGVIVLPDRVGGVLRPTSGTVIASPGPDVFPGERVIVERMVGLWLEPFEIPGYRAIGQVRIYGDATRSERHPRAYEPADGLIAVLEKKTMRPIRDRVLLKRADVKTESRGFELPDASKFRGVQGTVVRCGPGRMLDSGEFDPVPWKPHDEVVYNPLAPMVELEWMDETYPEIIEEFGGVGSDYCFIKSDQIHALIA